MTHLLLTPPYESWVLLRIDTAYQLKLIYDVDVGGNRCWLSRMSTF